MLCKGLPRSHSMLRRAEAKQHLPGIGSRTGVPGPAAELGASSAVGNWCTETLRGHLCHCCTAQARFTSIQAEKQKVCASRGPCFQQALPMQGFDVQDLLFSHFTHFCL